MTDFEKKVTMDPSGFVVLADVVPSVIQEIRYYSTYNFIGDRIDGYEEPCALITKEAARALKAVSGEGRTYVIDRSGWHLILLAKNLEGYHNLCRLVSAGYMSDAFYHTPRIDKELLEQWHKGIICSSACLGGELPQKVLDAISHQPSALSVQEAIEQGVFAEAEETIEWFKGIFGEDYYIELQRHETQKPGGDQEVFLRQQQVTPVLIELAHKHGVKLICSNDSHFVNEEDAEAHDRLICLSTNHFVNDVNRMHYTKQEWLKTPEEMYEIFQDIPEALENTQEIADKVEIYDIDHDAIMPKFDIPASFGKESDYPDRLAFESAYLRYLTMEGAKKRYGEERLTNDEELKERIEFELNTIINMGFPGYFLIVMDFIRAAREELDVSVGPGRGSAAGSVVAYCLRITDLDPLLYDLLFERFLNPDRISLPDIDTDFEDCGRGKVLDYVSRKYGETHVAHIVTYGKMATKSALADVGRVQQIPLPRVNELKALIPDREFPDTIMKKLPAGTTKCRRAGARVQVRRPEHPLDAGVRRAAGGHYPASRRTRLWRDHRRRRSHQLRSAEFRRRQDHQETRAGYGIRRSCGGVRRTDQDGLPRTHHPYDHQGMSA